MTVKPLRSADPGQATSVQFAHFGVLNDGAQSKTSTLTALALNILIAFVIIVVGAATKKTIDNRIKLTELTAPVIEKKIEPIKPKVIPPKMPKLPEVPKIQVQTPRIVVPEVKLPDVPKPPMVKMEEPKPIMTPAPPKAVVAMAAPKVVNLAAAPPALVNNSAHPTAVALGSPNNPLAATNATSPSKINLGNAGAAGMPSTNTGMGRPTTVNLAGSGSPGGSNKGTGTTAIQGVKLGGVTGGTPGGHGNATGVNLAQALPPPMPKPPAPVASTQRAAPKVIFKPKPIYTAEAIAMHLEGTVSVRIHVLANGSVEVVGVTSGLGHGLDEAAIRAVQATKFQPATDATGNPIPWDGVVNVAFQLAG